MKLKIHIVVLCVVSSFSKAQQTTQIQGRIMAGSQAAAFATYSVKKAEDSTVVKYGVAGEDGKYEIALSRGGSYFMVARAIGFKEHSGSLFSTNELELQLEDIVLAPDTQLMGEVDVVTFKPIVEVKPDMTVFNVANTVNATGTNGFDLLRQAPGVMIDNNDNIVLEGKEGVQIYFDGKQTLLTGEEVVSILKSMQSSDVEKLEIITQPSAKFDAAGGAGIINIVSKRNKNLGTNGTLVLGSNYGINLRGNASITLNNRTKTSQVYANYNNSAGESWNYMNLYRTQQGMVFDSRMENISDATTHNGKLGADWFLSDKHTLGVQGSINVVDSRLDQSTTTYIGPENSSSVDQVLQADNVNISNNMSSSLNLNYKFEDTLGHKLTLNGNYGFYNRERDNFQPNTYRDPETDVQLSEVLYRMLAPTEIDLFSIQADYDQNLGKGVISTGMKYSKVSTTNSFDFFETSAGQEVLVEERSNDFVYDEQIAAVYLNYSNEIGSKWKYQLGLRAEQTYSDAELFSVQQTTNDRVKREYLNLFPSGGLTYNLNRKHSFALNYSQRINRPNYQSLNPFVRQTDELSFSQGNPFLQPQYVSTAKLSHTFAYRFVTSFSYSFTDDYFAMIRDTVDESRSFLMTRNVANQRHFSLNLSLPFQVNDWWNAYLNIGGNYAQFIATDPKFIPIDQYGVSVYARNTFVLPAGFKLEVSGWYNSPHIMGGTYLIQSMGSLDLAVQKSILKDKLTIRLSVNDVLLTSPWTGDLEYSALQINASGGWESRRVGINVTYNFGNSQVKSFRRRQTGAEDEQRRIQ